MGPARIPLAVLPTPIHRLDRVSRDLGIDLHIKRDDLTGLALGGNKARKLEYLLADAIAREADVVITCGGVHSNFIRQLGAACGMCSLRCAAAVMDLPYEFEPCSADRLAPDRGSPTIDRILGIDLRHHPDGTWEQLYALAEDLAAEFEASGNKVYRIPVGGSAALGAFAFYKAADEVRSFAQQFDWIVTASSSGSTQTGLTYAFAGTRTEVMGISSDPEPELVNDFVKLGRDLVPLIGVPVLPSSAFHLNVDHVGPGYGVPSQAGNEAIAYLARTEGILLDPVYTGKAFAGLARLAKDGTIGGKVLFWHTGGVPALFAV